MGKPLISVLVVCYNNQNFIYECLESIFSQTYPNIEVLIGDDCSDDFDGQTLIGWINAKRTPNIQKVAIFRNETNQGTVANVENLQRKSRGEYLFNIAADDVLYDERVLDNLYETVLETGGDAEVVVAETELWSHDLSSYMGPFMRPGIPEFIESSTPRTLFAACADLIILPASYLYRRSVLEKVGNLSEQYRLVEDVPTHLRLLAQGVKPYYMSKSPSIKHRDGGISHGNTLQSKKAFLLYYNDICSLYANEILPHEDLLTPREKKALKIKYADRVRAYYKIHIPAYYKACEGDTEAAIKEIKAEEQAGRLPPTKQETPKEVAAITREAATRERIKQMTIKLSRKKPVIGSTLFSCLCFITSGCLGLLSSRISRLLSEIMLYLGAAFLVFTASAVIVNILLRIRHRSHGE